MPIEEIIKNLSREDKEKLLNNDIEGMSREAKEFLLQTDFPPLDDTQTAEPEQNVLSTIKDTVFDSPSAGSLNLKDKLIGAGEVARTIGTGMVSDFAGKVGGIGKEVVTGDFGKGTAEKFYEEQNPFGVYQPKTETGQRYLKNVADTLGIFEGLPPYAPVPSKFGVKKPARVPTQEQLSLQAGKLYDNAAASGVQFKTDAFNQQLLNIGRELRQEGYTPKGNKALSSVFKEGLETRLPKDFTELQAIRRMFKTAASDKTNPDYARQAMIALDKFDEYILNAPESDFIVAGKKGLESWKQARTAYSKMKKSEMFEDLINTAEKKTSEGGNLDRTLLNDLTSLSNNKDKMKFFTPDEQARINKLVKSKDIRGMAQRVFSLGGLFSPGFGSRAGQVKSALYTLGGTAGGAPLETAAIAGGTLLSRLAAEQMRKGGIRDLARFARAGGSEALPGGDAFQIILPTGSQAYGGAGILSNILEEDEMGARGTPRTISSLLY